MKIYYSEQDNALYIALDESKKVIDSKEAEKNLILDYDKNDNVVGLEILNANKHIPDEQLKNIQLKIVS